MRLINVPKNERRIAKQVLQDYARKFIESTGLDITPNQVYEDYIVLDSIRMQKDHLGGPTYAYGIENGEKTGSIIISTNLGFDTLFDLPGIEGPEVRSRFYLAHEITHALLWGEAEYDPETDTFNPGPFLEGFEITWFDQNGDPIGGENWSTQRNKGRNRYKEEVLTDAVASSLYAPDSLPYDSWINKTLAKTYNTD